MSSSQLALSLRSVSKAYTIRHSASPATPLAGALATRLRRPFAGRHREKFWALRDVSFDVQRGEVVGLVGQNGAGKSTLLKIVSRITEMTTGEVDLYGRVGSLLEVGAGFHPELTGRENIFLNGTLRGMTRAEVRNHFDAIVDFAGVERFLDTPVKRFSSGMYVRLAFAVAAHLRSDILMVDEVLAVGDQEFQEKCLNKLRDIATDGRTVLLVSHSMTAITASCSRGLVLRAGRLVFDGDIQGAVHDYLFGDNDGTFGRSTGDPDGRGTSAIRCVSLGMRAAGGEPLATVRPREPFELVVGYEAAADLHDVIVSVGIETRSGLRLVTLSSGLQHEPFAVGRGRGTFICLVSGVPLQPDHYSLDVLISSHGVLHDHVQRAAALTVAATEPFRTARWGQSSQGYLITDYRWRLMRSPSVTDTSLAP